MAGGDHIDRISDLPINVIDGILEHLSIGDIARTSILSRKWRHTWYSVPQLEFDDYFFEECRHIGDNQIYSIITEICLLHNGPIYKFVLKIPHGRKRIKVQYLAKLILFLSRNGIKDLELFDELTFSYQIPSDIFSCDQLTHLKLTNFLVSVPPKISRCFKSLVDLYLFNIKFEDDGLESLISGCPLLEKLQIYFCLGFTSIDLSAPKLKVLRIDCCLMLESICLNKAMNLIDLTLMAMACVDIFEASDLIKGLQKIERLVLKDAYTEILCVIPSSTIQRSFSFLRYLELSGVKNFNGREHFFSILSLLKSAPCLTELVINTEDNFSTKAIESHLTQVSNNLEELERNVSFNQLQIVTIRISKPQYYKNAMRLIRLILANSSSLETLTFKLLRRLKPSKAGELSGMAQEILIMPRASQKAKVKILYKD